ncbi:probable mitochondrial glutathione transporter SLC25A40 [Panonychus citri]|uniref:probable mitochondrial glutathione transporter SLC25A40 n=1 Tax=Panonychus citri TaxID=50023 RepID=UPI002308305D|nr:probable mitochondrial glutathione transporter SLC25A40 [Panonychus citri]
MMGSSDGLNFNITPGQQMASSCTGAIITSLIVTPLDVVKIRIQAREKEFIRNKCFLYCNGLMDHICTCNGNGNSEAASVQMTQSERVKWFKRGAPFTGTLDGIVHIARNEGITSLWSGLPPTLVMAIPSTVIYFTVYDQLRARINLHRGRLPQDQPLWVPMTAGGCARVIAAVTISPLELIRTKMQSEKLSYFDIGRAVRSLIQQEGILALYRGLVPTILRDVPFSALYWAGYEGLKRKLNCTVQPTFFQSFICGGIAGSVAAIITLPFDVVKTHRQIEIGQNLIVGKSNHTRTTPKSTVSIIKHLYSQRGLKGLFAGLSPRLIKVAPACAIMISTYEWGKSFFRHYNETRHKNVHQY